MCYHSDVFVHVSLGEDLDWFEEAPYVYYGAQVYPDD